MSSTTSTCNTCKKPRTKLCAKCHTTSYCSRECQQADWKQHKKTCATNAASRAAGATASSSSTQQGGFTQSTPPGNCQIIKPFHHLNDNTYLYNRPEKEVYKLLVDTYRLSIADKHNIENDDPTDSIYSGGDPTKGFRSFLSLAELRTNVLPSWWTTDKSKECMVYGTGNDWSCLNRRAEKSDISQHYGNSLMPMQLRMLGEKIYGRGVAGQSGAGMMRMMMMQETGSSGGHSSLLDASASFRH